MTPTPDQILDQIARLADEPPLSADRANQALGATLERQDATEWFVTWRAADVGPFASVYLQEAQPGAGNRGTLALELRPGPCVRFEQATARFGFAHKIPTHPGHPVPALEYWTHGQPWGTLKMAYDPATGCLVEVALKAR